LLKGTQRGGGRSHLRSFRGPRHQKFSISVEIKKAQKGVLLLRGIEPGDPVGMKKFHTGKFAGKNKKTNPQYQVFLKKNKKRLLHKDGKGRGWWTLSDNAPMAAAKQVCKGEQGKKKGLVVKAA